MNWKVRFIDYPKQFRNMEAELMETIRSTLADGDLILRKQTESFEANLAAFVGTRFSVGVSNCTDALTLTLLACGVGAGDEVITVSHTFVATMEAIHFLGAVPYLVDIGDDHNMDAELIEASITPRTRAIIPVNLNGRLCRMDRIVEIAERHGLAVIEDTAQALGASYRGKKGGAWGRAGCFSFYPAKILGAFGDAGAVVTSDPELQDKVHWLRNHGRTDLSSVAGWAFNHRIDNLQAAILDTKMQRLEAWIRRRREIARIYNEELREVKQLRLPPPPTDSGDYFDTFQNYEIEAENVEGLLRKLKEQGVEVMRPWGGRAVHQHAALGLGRFRLPRTEELFTRVMLLPMFAELEDDEIRYVAQVVKNFYR